MPQNKFPSSRRRFLKAAGTGLIAAPFIRTPGLAQDIVRSDGIQPAGTVLPDRAVGRPMPNGVSFPDGAPGKKREDSVGIAVIGLGHYALAVMMPRIVEAEGVHVAGLVSGNRDKAERVARGYNLPEDAIYSYDDFDRIAEDDRIEAVYVILPSGLHAAWTEKAFAAGKHVLCEKPMALSAADCQRMIDASETAGKKLMIGYRCHFEPYNLRAMEIANNDIGAPRMMTAKHGYTIGLEAPRTVWRVDRSLAGGGPLEDLGIYGLQGALYLTGEMPYRIMGSTYQPQDDPRFREIAATVSAQLDFPSGGVAQISSSYDSAGRNQMELVAADGALRMEPATSYSGNNLRVERGRDGESLELGESTVQFTRQMDHFAEAIRNGTDIETPGEMGLRDVRLIEAIYRSAERGRPVELNPDGTMRAG